MLPVSALLLRGEPGGGHRGATTRGDREIQAGRRALRKRLCLAQGQPDLPAEDQAGPAV